MNAKLKDILDRIPTWPEAAQDELTQTALEIEARYSGSYRATAEELAGIDDGLRDADQGRFVTEEQLEAVFAKYRRA